MASSSQQAAAPHEPAAVGGEGVDGLPDHLLIRILGALSLRERCATIPQGRRTPVPLPLPLPLASRDSLTCKCSCPIPSPGRQHAALVCRRWHSCAHVPELCRDVEVLDPRAKGRKRHVLRPPHDNHLLLWLRRHGQHVRRLSLRVSTLGVVVGEEVTEVAPFMSAAAAAMPQLEQLLVEWTATLYHTEWLGHLPASSLRELSFGVDGWEQGLELCSAINGLTQLTKLVLMARYLQLHEDVQLPPSLRTLAVNGEDAEQPLLQHQASTLGVLRGGVVRAPWQHRRSVRQA